MSLINLLLVWLKTEPNIPFIKYHVVSAVSYFAYKSFYSPLTIAAVSIDFIQKKSDLQH